jgi:hypothetical protein
MDTDIEFCNVCETNHGVGTEHPARLHQGPRTVRIKIAVAVTPDGDWNAAGWRNAKGETRRDAAIEGLDADEYQTMWIEADIPLIETPVVRGEVVK